jgi:hypothetical protein
MAMHRDFADWYRVASVTPQQEVLEQRWNAVEEAASVLSAASITVLLRLFAVRIQKEPTVPDFLDAVLRKHDTSYSSRGNSEELRVLAGAVLRQCIESNSKNAVAVALGLLCATFGSRATRVPAAQHVSVAETYLAHRGVSVRASTPPAPIGASGLTKERYDELVTIAVFQPPQIASARDPLFTAIVEASGKSAEQVNAAVTSLWRANQVVREELNLLWWLQTKFSRDLKKPFAEFALNEASYVFPMELSDLTVFLPGPDAILGIIITSLSLTKGGDQKSKLVDAVNSTPRAWREERNGNLNIQGFADLCPLLLAMSKSLDTDGDAEWLPVYRKQCDVQLDQEVPASDVAVQVYRERLFAQALGEIK